MENILQSFIQQKAKRQILTTALQDPEIKIDHNELEEKSAAFAMLLKDAGCREDDHICCMTEKMSSALIGMLGIMKAGCVCVPVNSCYSREQISSIMFETDSRWLLTDESFSALPDPALFETGDISLGWLGDSQKIPEGIVPEFISENIDQYSFRAVFENRGAGKSTFKFALPTNKNHFEELHIASVNIMTFIDQYRNVSNGRLSDRVAGFFPDHLLRFFLELRGSTKQETQFYLLADSLLEQPEKLTSFLYTHRIARLFVQADVVKRLAKEQTKKDFTCQTVKEVMIWGKLPPRQKIADLEKVFTECDIKNCFRGSIYSGEFSVPRDGVKVQSLVSHNESDAIPGQKGKFIFGFVEESTLNQFKSVSFIRDMKDVYLSFWRKIEEENYGRRLELR